MYLLTYASSPVYPSPALAHCAVHGMLRLPLWLPPFSFYLSSATLRSFSYHSPTSTLRLAHWTLDIELELETTTTTTYAFPHQQSACSI